MLPLLSIDGLESLLQWCRKNRSQPYYAFRLFGYMCEQGFESHSWIGNHLVSMLAEARFIDDAKRVFDVLPHRTLCTWNSLIKGYSECGNPHHALILYHRMLDDAFIPNGYTFVALLTVLGELDDLEMSYRIHSEIDKKGLLGRDLYVGSNLVHMYAKRGLLVEAQYVFEMLPFQNTVVWNTLIGGFNSCEQGDNALYYFKQMQYPRNAITFVYGLKACGMTQNIDVGKDIHVQIVRNGMLERNCFLHSALIEMYVKCGSLAKAHGVFDNLVARDIISWTALISGYILHDRCKEALQCLQLMELEGVTPNATTFLCSLKACANVDTIDKGMKLHEEIARRGLIHGDSIMGNTLVDMYATCGLLAIALEVFDELPSRDVISWNALIAGIVNQGVAKEALNCFEEMHMEGVSPDAITCISGLKACANINSPSKGQEIHITIVKFGFLDRDVALENALIDMYGKCDSLIEAREVFENVRGRDVVSWTTIMSAYSEQEQSIETSILFKRMQVEGILPNAATFLCGLKACSDIGDTYKGSIMHAEIVASGLFQKDFVLGDALINMYSKLGELLKSKEVFEKVPTLSKSSWNALLAGYAKHEHGKDALECFHLMQRKGFMPDHVTFIYCLKACGILEYSNIAADFHREISRREFQGTKTVVSNALIDMYGKCGLPQMAQEVFENLRLQDVVSWTSLMAGYIKEKCSNDAISCYEHMQHEGIAPNAVTFIYALKACGDVVAIAKGDEIHGEVVKRGFLETHLGVANALINMYIKSGWIKKARQVFDWLPTRNTMLWNVLIMGHAKCKQGQDAIKCFKEMQVQGFTPDDITFLGLLNACSHGSLVYLSYMYVGVMSNDYGILPTRKHYSCILDLLGRAGHLEEAMSMGQTLSLVQSSVTCRSLMGACYNWGNVELGRQMFKSTLHS